MITQAEINAALRAYFDANDALRAADNSSIYLARREYDRTWKELYAARRGGAEEFADVHGWKLSKWFTISQLKRGSMRRRSGEAYDSLARLDMLDHMEFFTLHGRPIAIVSHSYDKRGNRHAAFAARHELSYKRQPFSWYWPGKCVAVAFTAAAPVSP